MIDGRCENKRQTALSRAYYNHRYSDDLDFFVNDDDSFLAQADEIIAKLN